ncbi:MAG: LysM peptidoglycan-binding domain-containing protein [Gammaproteobacteria bacterium]
MRIGPRLLLTTIALTVSACNTLSPREQSASVATVTTGLTPAPVLLTQPEEPTVQPGASTGSDNSPARAPEKPYTNIWVRIKDNLTITRHTNHQSIKGKLAWYARNPDYLDRVAERARPYLYYIVEELEKRKMPLDLALLPVIESAYHPFAYSPSHASGIWQFIPSTGKRYGLKQNWWYDGRRDITAATRAALDYLQKLHEEFHGDWLLALAAYNSGERSVVRAMKRNRRTGKKQDFWSLRLTRETRGYVPSLLAVAEIVAQPAKYGITLKPIRNSPYFAQVDVGGQLDLATAASLADISMDRIYTLNPAFNRWATDPDGPHHLLIPVEKADRFKRKLATLPETERIKWKRHVIKRGESLGLIANRYHTSITAIKQTNGLRRNLIRTGHSLLIPTAMLAMNQYTLSLDARRFRGLKRTGHGEKYVYSVRRGDTLWDIGNHYGVSVRQLCVWNGISPHGLLRPKQKLNLWLSDNGRALAGGSYPVPAARLPVNLDRNIPETFRYTVKKGDSLWLISRRYGITVAQLRRWNNLPKGKYLQPGQKLLLHKRKIHLTDV